VARRVEEVDQLAAAVLELQHARADRRCRARFSSSIQSLVAWRAVLLGRLDSARLSLDRPAKVAADRSAVEEELLRAAWSCPASGWEMMAKVLESFSSEAFALGTSPVVNFGSPTSTRAGLPAAGACTDADADADPEGAAEATAPTEALVESGAVAAALDAEAEAAGPGPAGPEGSTSEEAVADAVASRAGTHFTPGPKHPSPAGYRPSASARFTMRGVMKMTSSLRDHWTLAVLEEHAEDRDVAEKGTCRRLRPVVRV
jgi:hypothetical protein